MSGISRRRGTLSPAKQELLARRLRGGAQARRTGELRVVPRAERGRAQLSFPQARLFRRMKTEAKAARNHYFMVRISGVLDVDALRRALAEMIRRHETLRTTFEEGPEGVRAVIASTGELEFGIDDVKASAVDGAVSEAVRRGHALGRLAFDLEKGPLVRSRLFRLGVEDHVLLIAIHLIVVDVWSLGVAIRELTALYNAFHGGRASPLPELAFQYGDFSEWQNGWLESGLLDPQLAYWREVLAGGIPLISLPGRGAPPDEERPFEEGLLPIQLPAPLAAAVRRCSREQSVSPYMTLLGAFDATLSCLTGETDIVVGTPIANRNHPGTEVLIGYFPNVLPSRVRVDLRDSFEELLEQVRSVTLGAYAHQDLPFDRFSGELLAGHPAGSPITRVLFSVQNAPVPEMQMDGLRIEPLVLDYGVMSPFDVTLLLIESAVLIDAGGGVGGMLHYNATLFSEAQVRNLWETYQRSLDWLLEHSRLPMQSLADDLGIPIPRKD